MNQEKIGKFICERRKEKKLTQAQLAEKLGVSNRTVSKWENGNSMPDYSIFNDLCDNLGVSIAELLSGELIEDNIKEKSEDALKNTIDYSLEKIKKNRIKNILFTVVGIFLLSCFVLLGYKVILVNKYSLDKPCNVEQVVNGLNNKKELKIYKKTIDEDKYLVIDNFKIKNDFFDYEIVDNNIENLTTLKKEVDGKNISITFVNDYQLIDYFVNDAEFYSKEQSKYFNSADRKYFLLKNDINDDVDFFNYISNNYFIDNNIFMDKRTLMENYAFNSFVSVGIAEINSITYISGDYRGYIFRTGNLIEVKIIRDEKVYGFITNDDRFKNDLYLEEILSTVEIR